jgi:deoxyribose-phosphate aldolase
MKLFSNKEFNRSLDEVEVVEKIKEVSLEIDGETTVDNMKKAFSCIDLTTLNSTDNSKTAVAIAQKVSLFPEQYPGYGNVAAICVYPKLVSTVKTNLMPKEVKLASVSAGFPSSMTFTEIKVAETIFTVQHGANEIDIVISIGDFLEGNFEEVRREISEIKKACGDAHLKVILETGALPSLSDVWKASLLAMEAGADFIKTSTGKISPAATPEASWVMCEAIKFFYEKSGKKIGFKAAGGISETEDAIKYLLIVKEVLGNDWLNNDLFRIGASRLANNLLTSICGEKVNFF